MEQHEFYAHIATDGRRQAVVDHNQGTARLSSLFATRFGMQEHAYFTGMAHDIGKYAEGFQRRLQGDNTPFTHSTAGAVECALMQQNLAAMCVAGHHGGLPDFGNPSVDMAGDNTLVGRLKEGLPHRNTRYMQWQGALPHVATLPAQSGFDAAMQCRMLFSCLVDADYLDTEAFMQNSPRPIAEYDMHLLWERLSLELRKFAPSTSRLGEIRNGVLHDCVNASDWQPGLFSLTVPTGGGKTLSSLAFALAHACRFGLNRVIYVVPYTTIIEQTADVFRRILGADMVLEHHANIEYSEVAEDGNPSRMLLATENWDAPIVVTTAVQFFESLYANKPSKCRKLHNIASSVVIFDEAQMIPTNHLRPCVAAICTLVRQYRVSAVLCTATQPALTDLLQEYAPQYALREINLHLDESFFALRRVRYEDIGRCTREAISARLTAREQVLCIVNTRKQAKDLFEQLPPEGRYHLSTLMYPEHRRKVLVAIRDRLAQGLPCRVVATSLVEAGVDIDFPVVFRERAGLDSIVQAAGRCNREGKRSPNDSVVYLFETETNTPRMLRINIGATNEAMRNHNDWGTKESTDRYFAAYRSLHGDNIDVSGAYKHLQDGIAGCMLPMRTVAENFHLIEDNTRAIYIPCADNEEMINALRQGQFDRKTLRRMGQYAVNVYDKHYMQLLFAGDIEPWGEGAFLCNTALYNEQSGLSLEADSGRAEFV